MTAYNFQQQFVPAVERLDKRQTIRGPRKRHARPGESVQLYTGMRHKSCRKLVDPDPVCTAVNRIAIYINRNHPYLIENIIVKSELLDADAMEAFARADGFDPDDFPFGPSARGAMGLWFLKTHGEGKFTGVVIKWEPAP